LIDLFISVVVGVPPGFCAWLHQQSPTKAGIPGSPHAEASRIYPQRRFFKKLRLHKKKEQLLNT
jgi:hypothetical protein